jgi:hypothetical protein
MFAVSMVGKRAFMLVLWSHTGRPFRASIVLWPIFYGQLADVYLANPPT